MKVSPGRNVLFLSYDDIGQLGITMRESLDHIEQALSRLVSVKEGMAPKAGLYPTADAWLHASLAMDAGIQRAVLKWQSGFDTNRKKGLRYMMGLVILNDLTTGAPLAIMESTLLTAMRTGAVSGITAKHLARPGVEVAAIAGCGFQARTQLDALAATLSDLREVRCYDIDPHQTERYISQAAARHPTLKFSKAASPQDAISPADIVVTAGPIQRNAEPTIQEAWFKEGSLGLPIDFDSYWQPAAQTKADKVFVDSMDNFLSLRAKGFFHDTPLPVAELSQVLTGGVKGREHPWERIICFNLGLALEDLAIATLAYDRAIQTGAGASLEVYPG